ncbi:hypothetical protein FHR83_002084 [Actinoplanes campanulatus]|uniref:NACHT domain-containing protein n=1 Tax=Actinoplanes campanulatus TaxID=113559 RepID=A0A7W5AE84_9ACTN|nr:hypothetical protein [Actinoplanes campanulatus]MBB3094432.1 hypothetical protein [Actinoplanes campanulatus]GGN20977.1 hypothetical protein GCM10010109_34960 [Actinoplanes campanulatus]GID35654.1 hypothetical protein Aca09nite_21600 [Actinoplanes campanulatus]
MPPTEPRRRLAQVAGGVAVAACLAVLLARHEGALSTADQLASVGSLIVALVLGVLGLRRGAPTTPDPADDAADRLAERVRRQWRHEIGVRRLEQPRALRLSWTPATPAVAGVPAPLAGSLDRDAPAAHRLVELVRATRPGQLVVLGAPGSGKSSLMTLFTVAAVDLAEPGDPIPVLLALPAWDTREPLDDWIARRVAGDYPGTRADLVAEGRVLPILDGLDELPDPALAFDELNRIAASLPGLVLTCRDAEYERAVAARGPLGSAAVVRIEPVPPDDAIAFLTDSDLRGSTRWLPVARRLRDDPGGDLATTLTNPLMISLARAVYRAPATDPAELLRMPGDIVDTHLLGEFLRAAYPAERDRRRLALLAAGPQLRWWTLASLVRSAVLTGVIAALLAGLGAAAGAGIAALSGYRFGPAIGYATVTGLALGVLAGLRTARTARGGEPSGGLGVLAAALRDGLAAGTVFAIGGTAALAAIGGSGAGLLGPLALLGVVGGTMFGIISNGLAAGRRIVPYRFGRRAATLPRRIAHGCVTASAFSLPAAAVIAVLNAVERWDPAQGVLPLVPSALAGTLVTGVGGALAIGVPIGVGRWLSVPDVTDPDQAVAATFRSSLRSERETLLITTLGAGLAVGAVTAAAVGLFGDGLPGLGDGSVAATAAVAAAVAAAPVMVLAVFGSGAPWIAYTVARAWLAARGRLPWRLTRFLEDAHRRQVLRQDGPAYRFRHERLRSHLAGDPPPASATPKPSGVRRSSTTATALAGVVLLLVTGTTVVPAAARTVAAKVADAACRLSLRVAVAESAVDTVTDAANRFNRLENAVCDRIQVLDAGPDPLAPPPDGADVWIPESYAAIRAAPPGVTIRYPLLGEGGLVLAFPERAKPHLDGAGWPEIAGYLSDPGRWRRDTGGRLGPLRVILPDPGRSAAGLSALTGLAAGVAGKQELSVRDSGDAANWTRVADVLANVADVEQHGPATLCEREWDDGVTVVITEPRLVRDVNTGWCGWLPARRWHTTALVSNGIEADLPFITLASVGADREDLASAFYDFLRPVLANPNPDRLLPDIRDMVLVAVAAQWPLVRPPVTAVLVVDASGSMRGRMDRVRRTARPGMAALGTGDRLGLWSFSGGRRPPDPGYRQLVATEPARDVYPLVGATIDRIAPGGDSPAGTAVAGVHRWIRETMPRNRHVNLVVVSDGVGDRPYTAAAVTDELVNRDGPPVETILIELQDEPGSGDPYTVTPPRPGYRGAMTTFAVSADDAAADAFRQAFTWY